MIRPFASLFLTLAVALFAVTAPAADQARPGVVSFVKVLSDKVEDVSSIDAWKRSFIKDGMSDQEKALKCFESVFRFRHQDSPPNEFLSDENHPHDVIKCWNVYGYGQCCCASANLCALARHVGLQARGWGIIAHSVPEVYFDGAWHMLDSSLMTYFPKPDGKIASVDELTSGVMEWYEKNPGFKDNDKKLREFMRGRGWKKGPEVLANCPFYDDNGWFMAATHGWYASMGEYADKKKTFVYEYGHALGYQVNVQLREGERLTRNWFNKGMHVNQLEKQELWSAKAKVGKDDYRYTPKYGDIAPGRVGNGLHEYELPLASGAFRKGLLSAENIASTAEDKAVPAVHVADASKPGSMIVRMPSSYIYLSGTAELSAVIGAGGEISVAYSDNHGLDWKDVAKITATGSQSIDLTNLCYRRYDYRLKVTMKGAGTGLERLKLSHDVQHSQRVLPALTQGPNAITASAGPAEGTITIEASTIDNKGKNLTYKDFKPVLNNVKGEPFFLTAGKGDITYAVETPGDMVRLRTGFHYRARDKNDMFDIEASFDGGKTFRKFGHVEGPTQGLSTQLVCSDVPAGTRSALLRFSGQQRNTAGILNLRIDADYKEPHGGFRPVKITYIWDEDGQEKRDVHVAASPEDKWTINCAQKPLMKSLIVELADQK
ncbi:MAG TPA: hypothetical protein VEK08_18305 [Planctomycetota bacterium]|nr:hypothetical protein [Planctomycetota bacterium]